MTRVHKSAPSETAYPSLASAGGWESDTGPRGSSRLRGLIGVDNFELWERVVDAERRTASAEAKLEIAERQLRELKMRREGELEANRSRMAARRTRTNESEIERIRGFIHSRDGNQCTECGSRKNLQIDHIVPVSQGGTDAIDNLQLLCRSCNSEKGSR